MPTAKCQTAQSDLPPSTQMPHAGTLIMPNITMTNLRVHNHYALPGYVMLHAISYYSLLYSCIHFLIYFDLF